MVEKIPTKQCSDIPRDPLQIPLSEGSLGENTQKDMIVILKELFSDINVYAICIWMSWVGAVYYGKIKIHVLNDYIRHCVKGEFIEITGNLVFH